MNSIREYKDLLFSVTSQRELRLDLRVPETGFIPPLVMYIPMGGMRVCNREHTQWWLLEHGFAMASMEARVSGEAVAPAAVHDCKAAVRWLRAHAQKYGYDGERIGVWGKSAGGLLASLLATSGDRVEVEGYDGMPPISSSVQAACDECGAPHDLTYFLRSGIAEKHAGVTENLRLYLGGPLAERLKLARWVSPSTYISPQCPPVLLLHGDQDSVVPLEDTIEFHKGLVDKGVDSTLRVLPGVGHSWEPELTREDIAAFFTRTLMSPGA